MGQYQVKKLSGQHKEAIRLSVIGLRDARIAESTGLSVWQISRVRNSELGRKYSDELNHRLDVATAHTMAASMLAVPRIR